MIIHLRASVDNLLWTLPARALHFATVLLLVAMCGCSGSEDDADPVGPQPLPGAGYSGVPTSKLVADLSVDESGALCDFTARVLGGYGSAKVCGTGEDAQTFSGPQSRDACIEQLQVTAKKYRAHGGCRMTAGDLELIARSYGNCTREPGFDEMLARFAVCNNSTASSTKSAASLEGFAQGALPGS